MHSLSGQEKVAEFSGCLKDRTFVDYFNVFLSLPCFSQRVLYRFSDGNFELDPPIRRKNFMLDRKKVIAWLISERLPLFERSELHVEHTLCKELLTTWLQFSHSSHFLQNDETRVEQNASLLFKTIGQVVGMCHFRHHLKDTAGESILNFWLDAERFSRLSKQELAKRKHKFREMQVKYFTVDGLVKLTADDKWNVLYDGTTLLQKIKSCTDLAQEEKHCGQNTMNLAEDRFRDLQKHILHLLQEYWLQKYILHVQAIQLNKILQVNIDRGKPQYHHLKTLTDDKDVANLQKFYRQIVGQGQPETKTSQSQASSEVTSAGAAAKPMFPDHVVDNSFLAGSDDVVMLGKDGKVSVTLVNTDEMDRIIENMLSDSSTSTSPDSNGSCDGSDDEVSRPPSYRDSSSNADKTDNKKYTDELLAKIKNADRERNAALLTKENMVLFEQLVTLHTLSRGRQMSSPAIVPSETKIKLPEIGCEIKAKCRRRSREAPAQDIMPHTHLPIIQECGGHVSNDGDTLHFLPANTDARICEPNYKYVNMSQGSYRCDNRVFVLAVAADQMAGSPFRKYLEGLPQGGPAGILDFWNGAQIYLTMKESKENCRYRLLKFRRARMLVIQHLESVDSSGDTFYLPPGLIATLLRLLPGDSGDGLLRQAQDIACQALHPLWKEFLKIDQCYFQQSVVVKKGWKVKKNVSFPAMVVNESETPSMPLSQFLHQEKKQQKSVVQTSGSLPDKLTQTEDVVDLERPKSETQANHLGLMERRMWRAMQLAQDVCDISDEGLPIDSLPVGELAYDDVSDLGSLFMKKIQIIYRKDMEEKFFAEELYLERQQKELSESKNQEAKKKKKATSVDCNLPYYLRPFRLNGQWVYRPGKPRNFQEVLRDNISIEFFRRFLNTEHAETPLLFWIAVEELKKCKDGRGRQQKISQIVRKFFSKTTGKGVEALQCTAEVVMEIPKMPKVTQSMLVSAQSCVARSLEETWFLEYLKTFTKEKKGGDRQHLDSAGAKKTWNKQRTHNLWIQFVRSVTSFRRGILRMTTAQVFRQYLSREMKKEIAKQTRMTGQSHVQGISVRKVICNKLVAVDKLINDLNFLIETDRYMNMCDVNAQHIESGIYTCDDVFMIENKAKMIIDCYINSEIPPRLQINISQDMADVIMENYESGAFDRGLFFRGMISIYPVLGNLWRKFQQHRFRKSFRCDNTPTPTAKKSETPDYFNTSTEMFKRMTAQSEDDHSHIAFSLAQGIRLLTPLHQPKYVKPGSKTSDLHSLHASSKHSRSHHSPSASRKSEKRLSIHPSMAGDGSNRPSRMNTHSDHGDQLSMIQLKSSPQVSVVTMN